MSDTSAIAGQMPSRPVPVVVKPIRWGQVALGAGAVAVLALIAALVGQSQNVQWSQVPVYLVDPSILSGIVLTLELTAAAMAIGIVLGAVLAAMAISQNTVLKAIAAAFVWAFRGVPLIVQIFFWFNIALFVPNLTIGTLTISINDIVSPPVAGLLALGLAHEAANVAEP